jgi:hypothetical protein
LQQINGEEITPLVSNNFVIADERPTLKLLRRVQWRNGNPQWWFERSRRMAATPKQSVAEENFTPNTAVLLRKALVKIAHVFRSVRPTPAVSSKQPA